MTAAKQTRNRSNLDSRRVQAIDVVQGRWTVGETGFFRRSGRAAGDGVQVSPEAVTKLCSVEDERVNGILHSHFTKSKTDTRSRKWRLIK